jgi:hypothetical protein
MIPLDENDPCYEFLAVPMNVTLAHKSRRVVTRRHLADSGHKAERQWVPVVRTVRCVDRRGDRADHVEDAVGHDQRHLSNTSISTKQTTVHMSALI